MKIKCNICKKEFYLSSEKNADIFCKHVLSCLPRTKTEYSERFQCSICDAVLRRKRSFREHIQHHITKTCSNNYQNVNSNQILPKDSRQLGKYIYLFIGFYEII